MSHRIQSIITTLKSLGDNAGVHDKLTVNKHTISRLIADHLRLTTQAVALDYPENIYIDGRITDKLNDKPLTVIPETTAEFHPQIWDGDYAYDADPEGDTEWTLSFEDAVWVYENLDNATDLDQLRTSTTSKVPGWIYDWDGPFEITVAGDHIDEYKQILLDQTPGVHETFCTPGTGTTADTTADAD